MEKVSGPCAELRCDLSAVTRAGFCLKHYKRWKRRGTTHDISIEERFFGQAEQVGDCWLWTGSKTFGGYGKVGVEGRTVLAHRWSYEFMVAEIPEGLKLDHLCSAPACVNPWHLEPVTQRINLLRSRNYVGVNARKTHCIRGHAFDEANTYLTRGGRRHCKACARIRERK